MFQGLSRGDLDGLAATVRTRTLKPREEVFHKGDEGAELYVVVEGRFKALTTSPEGDDVVFNVMGPGEVFGEVALLTARPRSATVCAIEGGRLMSLGRREFLAFLQANPAVVPRLLSLLAERLVRASEFVEEIQFLNLPVRLARKLVTLARQYGRTDSAGPVTIDLSLSQEEWGDLVGATRESINKQLRTWSEQGLVRFESGRVTLLDPAAIERLSFSLD